MIDDLRAEVGPYRNKTVHFTPHIDEFAEHAVTFKHSYANVALCGPSRASLFTGRSPRSLNYFQHNLRDINDASIIDRAPTSTLPKFFENLGYRTVGAGKVFHRDSNLNEFQESLKSNSVPCECNDVCPQMICTADDEDLTDTAVVDFSLEKLEEFKENDENFFMAVGIRKPHLPYRVPQRSLDKIKKLYGEDLADMPVPDPKTRENESSVANYYCDAMDQYFSAIEESKGRKLRQDFTTSKVVYPTFKSENDYFHLPTFSKDSPANIEPKIVVSTQLGSEPVADDLLRELKFGYFAAVNWADELFGRIDQRLKDLDLYKDTVVVVFADNGFNLGEQGNFCKNNNFEIGTKVPLFVRHPENSPKRSQKIVTLLDLYPSVIDLALDGSYLKGHPNTIQTTKLLHGTSFADEVLGRTKEDEAAISETAELAFSAIFRCWNERDNRLESCDRFSSVNVIGFSVRSRSFRYTEWREFDDYSFSTRLLERELYDHSKDLDQFPDKTEIDNLMNYLFDNAVSRSLPSGLGFTEKYLENMVEHLSNHLEAHYSCEELDCVPISSTLLPTTSPSQQPTNLPTQNPSKISDIRETRRPTTTIATTPVEPEVDQPNTNDDQIVISSGSNKALSAAISIVIMLACVAIAIVIILYMKKKQADAAKRAYIRNTKKSQSKA